METQNLQDIPDVARSEFTWEYLRKNASDDKLAQIFADDGTSKTYKELYRDSVYVAAGLKEMGIKSGDVASIVSRNSHELFPVVLGCVMAGVILAPSVVELNANELRSNFELTKPTIILTTNSKRTVVEEAIENAGSALHPRPKVYEVLDFFNKAVSKGSNTDLETFEPFRVADPSTSIFACMYSSGTTGVQKAIAKFNEVRTLYAYSVPYTHEGTLLYMSQPSASTWSLTLFSSLLQNRTRIFFDNLDIQNIANAIHKYKPTLWTLAHPDKVIFLRNLLQENPGKWDISSLKKIECIGDILGPVVHEDLYSYFQIPIINVYGATEIGLPFNKDLNSPPVFGSIGTPKRKVKLVDPDTREEIKDPNRLGELLVFGVNVMYWNNAEATKNATEDGWYKTGDMLYFNKDGYYFVVSRVKEIFKCLSYQVAPQEIEAYMRKIPGVAEVVVVGKKADITVGELPTAFVVRTPNSKITEQDILDYLEKQNLHTSKKLRGGVRFIDKMPRNANNKILRRKVQEIVNKESTLSSCV